MLGFDMHRMAEAVTEPLKAMLGAFEGNLQDIRDELVKTNKLLTEIRDELRKEQD